MATDWTQLRVRRATRERIEVFIGRLIVASDNGQVAQVLRYDRAFTVDDALNILLDRADSHQARARKSRKKKIDTEVIDLGFIPDPGG